MNATRRSRSSLTRSGISKSICSVLLLAYVLGVGDPHATARAAAKHCKHLREAIIELACADRSGQALLELLQLAFASEQLRKVPLLAGAQRGPELELAQRDREQVRGD